MGILNPKVERESLHEFSGGNETGLGPYRVATGRHQRHCGRIRYYTKEREQTSIIVGSVSHIAG